MKIFLKILLIFIASVFLAMALFATAFNNRLTVRTYNIPADKLGHDVTVVLLADLHSYIYGEEQDILAEMVAAQKPDIIALAGDIADDQTPIDGTRMLLEKISDIAPCYYVTGNHEHWSGEIDEIIAVFEAYGVRVLRDEYETVRIRGQEVLIAGIDDPDSDTGKSAAALSTLFDDIANSPLYTILLAHRPERHEDYAGYGFDLVLSGHAHGGQVRIPFLLNGLFAPNQGWLPEYAGGLYENGATHHIVSRGLVLSERLPRIFNPPEVCVVHILAQ